MNCNLSQVKGGDIRRSEYGNAYLPLMYAVVRLPNRGIWPKLDEQTTDVSEKRRTYQAHCNSGRHRAYCICLKAIRRDLYNHLGNAYQTASPLLLVCLSRFRRPPAPSSTPAASCEKRKRCVFKETSSRSPVYEQQAISLATCLLPFCRTYCSPIPTPFSSIAQ